MAADFTAKITDLLMVGILCTALLGTIVAGFSTMAADTTNFSATERALLAVIGIFVVLGIVVYILKITGVSKK